MGTATARALIASLAKPFIQRNQLVLQIFRRAENDIHLGLP
jgi:hypothetical protein